MSFYTKYNTELYKSLKNDRVIPLKFLYLGGGAEKWGNVAKQRISPLTKEIPHPFLRALMEAMQIFEKVSIIDIGPGNGESSLPFIRIAASTCKGIVYKPIDISSKMLAMSRRTVRNFFNISILPTVLDIENDVIPKKLTGRHNLFLLLGGTIANLRDPKEFLARIIKIMNTDDILIFDCTILETFSPKKMMKRYSNKNAVDFKTNILKSLNFREFDYCIEWNPVKRQIDTFAILQQSTKVRIGVKNIIFEKGEKISIGTSRVFEFKEIDRLIRQGNLSEMIRYNFDSDHFFCLIK